MTRTALIFPGQGSQSVGMGKEFYDASAEAKAIFDQAERVMGGLCEIIFNGPEEKLTSTKYCQPAIFTVSMAALAAFKAHESFAQITPVFTAGHSLGEYSAVCASGALDFPQTLALVERRAFFMDQAAGQSKGAMAAVIGFDAPALKEICQTAGAQVANYNSPDQIVITGDAACVAKASSLLTAAGAKRVVPLTVSGAFHSSLMQPAQDAFQKELTRFSFQAPQFSVVSNVNAKPSVDPQEISANLAYQITSSVLWTDSIQFIASQGVSDFIEIGPGNVLKGLLRKINRDLQVRNVRVPSDLSQ